MAYEFLSNGQPIELDEARKRPILVFGEEATGSSDRVLTFTDDGRFEDWATNSAVNDRIDTVRRRLDNEVLPLRGDSNIERQQRLALRRTMLGFRGLAREYQFDIRSEELINLAMVDRTPLTPSLFDPVLLYDRLIERLPPTGAPEDPRTRLFPIPSGFWPDLSWCGWNNRARSVRIFGLNVLCDDPWFGGKKAWLFGFNGLLNLDTLGIDRTTSSIISF